MLGDAPLSLREFVMHEPHPLATIQAAVFDFLRGRTDCAVFGSQSVNAYVTQQRSTEDVDVESVQAEALANNLKIFLNLKFHIATMVCLVRGGIGYWVYQVRKPQNRYLVDIRPVAELSKIRVVDGVPIVEPATAIANKVQAIHARAGKPKALTDARDLIHLLRIFPELKTPHGPVRNRINAAGGDPAVIELWEQWVAREFEPEDEDDEFDY